jgi:carboxyl-terminal processing protease
MLDQNIAYVAIYTFGDTTSADLKTTLTDLLAKNPKGLILDLRDNGGGYLTTAIEVVSQFIDSGVVMYEDQGNGQRQTYTAISGGLATSIPLVVLVNGGTASASEITAGAIQDYGRGKLVGTTTYGKGSVQNWIPLENNQGAVRITIARWLTPKERQINGVGLTPDVVIDRTEADIQAGKDPQLEKAIELLVNP